MKQPIVQSYLFTSERLGFRPWREADIPTMARLNTHPLVMKYFPSTQTLEQTEGFVDRMRRQFAQTSYCYFAVDTLINRQFIGFIGLSDSIFKASFTPCVDMGWRLSPEVWGKGLATEGAARCLAYAFQTLNLSAVKAIAPTINQPSIAVMKKIGMAYELTFKHPFLTHHPTLEDCVLYGIDQAAFDNRISG